MKTKNVGLIQCASAAKLFELDSDGGLNDYNLKKVLLTGNASASFSKLQYPDAEWVSNEDSIIQDHEIDLVIVAAPAEDDMGLVGKVLQSGKHVRIV